MDAQEKLDEIVRYVRRARGVPVSASCVVNRDELLGLLDEARMLLPQDLATADELLSDRGKVFEEAQREAERILADARGVQERMLQEHEVVRAARAKAEEILRKAREEAAGHRRQADDYVDAKLANFEVVLEKVAAAVNRGREKLHGSSPYDQLAADDGAGTGTGTARPADPAGESSAGPV